MEQRRLRLGDILDDYCPRERRVTNHVVVAMIEDDVKQTRCSTCEAEHVYKGGKEPRRRSRKDSPAGLFREVLAGMPEQDGAPAAITAPDSRGDDLRSEDEVQAAQASQDQPLAEDEPVQATVEATPDAPEPPVDDGHFHRRLIRAQLPRPEGQKEVRQVPDFTIRHQNNGRGPFRGRGPNGAGQPGGAGNRPHGRRFAGGGNPGMPGHRGPSTGSGRGPGPGRGPSQGPGRGPSAGPGRGPRKRSR